MMSSTLKDIAQRTGKSITTVSRALNDYDDVSPKTKTLVHRVAEELGYTPTCWRNDCKNIALIRWA